MQETDARVEVNEDGQVVLIDPTAAGVIAAVENHNEGIARSNCTLTYEANLERVEHFKKRLVALEKSSDEYVVVIISVDDENGGLVADALMPGMNWQPIRDSGQVPIARGLAGRDFITECLNRFDPVAAERLKNKEGVCTVVVDHGVAGIY
jgi:hypothetical protein